jgi:hypothetical protein
MPGYGAGLTNRENNQMELNSAVTSTNHIAAPSAREWQLCCQLISLFDPADVPTAARLAKALRHVSDGRRAFRVWCGEHIDACKIERRWWDIDESTSSWRDLIRMGEKPGGHDAVLR